MADESFIYFVLALVIGWFILGGLLVFRFNVYLQREHVFWTMKKNDGLKDKGHSRPDKDGALHLKWGKYFTHPEAFHIVKPYFWSSQEKREFDYKQSDPFPYKIGYKREVHDNPGEVVYTAIPERMVIPAETLEIMEKQHLFRDMYQKALTALVIIAFILIVVIFLLIGLYAK